MNSLDYEFIECSYDEYMFWVKHNPKIAKKINTLIKDICNSPTRGIGKPEQLKYELSGCWSRRINSEHRLVYRFDDEKVTILSCRYHY